MNLIVGAPAWVVALLALTLTAAAIEDAVRLRISNATCAAVFVEAILAMALHGFSVALWQNGVVFLSIFLLGALAFGAGWLGGGDVKLLAALGLWMDIRGAGQLLGAIFLAGGVVALLFLLSRLFRRRGEGPKSRDIPYGLAITAGALIAFWLQSAEHQTYVDRLRTQLNR
jgi:prepilin peptidase CpaA